MDEFLEKFKKFKNYEEYKSQIPKNETPEQKKLRLENDVQIWDNKIFEKQNDDVKEFLAGLLYMEQKWDEEKG